MRLRTRAQIVKDGKKYQALLDSGMTIPAIAERMGCHRQLITSDLKAAKEDGTPA